MLNKHLEKFLKKEHVRYDVLKHTPAYTAQEIAAAAHISGKQLVKSVIVKIDGKLAMLVGPSNTQFDLSKLKELLNAKKVELASEYEFQDKFKDCEVGAMPAVGTLYNLDVYVDDCLLKGKDIAFNAGNHSELIKMSFADWSRVARPKIVHLH